MDLRSFEQLVERSYRRIPKFYLQRIHNVVIVVEQEPSEAALRSAGVPAGSTLLGLYHGIPLTKRTSSYSSLPDRISIYQGPLERAASGPADLERMVDDTLWHEIGHYFGLNEAEVRRVEMRRERLRRAELRRRKPAG